MRSFAEISAHERDAHVHSLLTRDVGVPYGFDVGGVPPDAFVDWRRQQLMAKAQCAGPVSGESKPHKTQRVMRRLWLD